MRLPKHRTVPKVLSRIDCWTIIQSAKSLHLKAALQTAFSCGLRVGDVSKLRVENVDPDRMQLVVRETKGLDERVVPLPPSTLDILRAYWREHQNREWLFPSRRKLSALSTATEPVSERSLQRGLQSILETLGWADRGIVFHTLRHSYGTLMLDEGVNLKVLQRYLGHKNLQATEVYLHLSQRADERARRIVADMLNEPKPETSPSELKPPTQEPPVPTDAPASSTDEKPQSEEDAGPEAD